MTQKEIGSVRLRNTANAGSASNPGTQSCANTPLPGRKQRPVSTGGRVESSIPETVEFKDNDENRNQGSIL
jgi:hypothetical protein